LEAQATNILNSMKHLKENKKKADQANKGVWWMPWHQSAMKDVASCEKPRGAAKQALIRGYPNGETRKV
jgi:hypothetical protein